MAAKQFNLPIAVISPTDIARLLRELESLDEYFRQTTIREGHDPQDVPRYSRLLDELVVENTVNLLDETDRQHTVRQLEQLQTDAPVLHVSFSVDPPGSYTQKIVAWIRSNIHPQVLVTVGLQPNIGAGCVVRSTNHTFDFSLRQYFETKHDFFMEKLHQVLVSANRENSTESSEVVTEQAPEQPESPAPEQPAQAVQPQPEEPVPQPTPKPIPVADAPAEPRSEEVQS